MRKTFCKPKLTVPTEQGSNSKPCEMITAPWSMLLLGRSEASPAPHHVDSCVFWVSWEAPPQKHSVQVCVISIEQCRNVLTGSGRWLLSCTMALAFCTCLFTEGHTSPLNKYVPANRHFIKGFLLIHCNSIQSIFCPKHQKGARGSTHFLIPLCDKSWQHYSVLKRFQ